MKADFRKKLSGEAPRSSDDISDGKIPNCRGQMEHS